MARASRCTPDGAARALAAVRREVAAGGAPNWARHRRDGSHQHLRAPCAVSRRRLHPPPGELSRGRRTGDGRRFPDGSRTAGCGWRGSCWLRTSRRRPAICDRSSNRAVRGFQVIGVAENGSEALELARTLISGHCHHGYQDGRHGRHRARGAAQARIPFHLHGHRERPPGVRICASSARIARRGLPPGSPSSAAGLEVPPGDDRREGSRPNHRVPAAPEILRSLLAGSRVEAWQRQKYLPFERYRVAVLRAGAPPSRYHASRGRKLS